MNEVEGFLALDEGLASRISEIVKFEDYSEEELRAITKSMILEKGFEASEDALDSAVKYLAEKKSRDSRTFGNAREARKLCDALVRTVALKSYTEMKQGKRPADIGQITKADMESAIRTAEKSNIDKGAEFGFAVSKTPQAL